MVSKKKVPAKRSNKVPKSKILIELSRRARREIDKLVRRSEAGTLTDVEASTGLKETKVTLQEMRDYIDTALSDVSNLLERTDTSLITSKQLKIKLIAVRKQVKRMLWHGNGDHQPPH